jgi:hypothetical protein
MAAEPVPLDAEPVIIDCTSDRGRVIVPVNVPPESVIVKEPMRLLPLTPVRGKVPLKVPLPIFVSVAVPVALNPVPEKLPVAFTVRVVLIVAAFAIAPAKIARAHAFMIPVIWFSSEKTSR